MCGRYFLVVKPPELESLFGLSQVSAIAPRYNIAPTQSILTVSLAGASARPTLSTMRWGLVPHWSKSAPDGRPLVNARLETASVKPSFQDSWRRRRCLVPATGYYEWERSRGTKEPYLFALPRAPLFAMAGLWDSWTDPKTGESLHSCALLTTSATGVAKQVHHRMPVVLQPEHFAEWLDSGAPEVGALLGWCVDSVSDPWDVTAVSKHVNNARNDDADCIKPLARPQGDLFL